MHFALALLFAAAPVATVKLTESGGAKVGLAAPSFGGWDLSGKKVLTLDNLRHKPSPAPLLITFGASWCTACASGLPRLHALSVKHPELRLVLIDVEMDADKAQAFASKYQVDEFALLDKFEQVAKTYGVAGDEKTALPRTFLLDTQGKVRAIYREEGADLEQVIEADLQAAKTPARPQ
jgi:peroxiredoxin